MAALTSIVLGVKVVRSLLVDDMNDDVNFLECPSHYLIFSVTGQWASGLSHYQACNYFKASVKIQP
jgi:hypothetical protein